MFLFGLIMESRTFTESFNLQTVVMVIWISCCARESTSLKCLDCVGACINPGSCETNDKCFIRRDVNGYLYRGCADDGRWQGLDHGYTGCDNQDYLGYAGQQVLWCFCSTDECNKNLLSKFPLEKILDSEKTAKPKGQGQNDKEGTGSSMRNGGVSPTQIPMSSTQSSFMKSKELSGGVLNDLSNPTLPPTISTQSSTRDTSGTARTVKNTRPPYTIKFTLKPIRATKKNGLLHTLTPPIYSTKDFMPKSEGTTPQQVPDEDYRKAPVINESIVTTEFPAIIDLFTTTKPVVDNFPKSIISPAETPPGGYQEGINGGILIADVCPEYFEAVPQFSSCYRFIREALSFNDARERCRQLAPSADLITMETNGEYIYIVSRIKKGKALLNGWQGWWTSGKYNDRIREFIWITSSRVISRMDLRWRKSLLIQPYVRTCVWMVPLSDYKLGNYGCKQRAGFICEMPMQS